MNCRFCGSAALPLFVDLGFAPPSNAYRKAADLERPEVHYPLRVRVCERCWLAQTEDYARSDELFDADYAYFSATSASWMDHARRYCAHVTERLALTDQSLVVELASNDGYLLRNFVGAGIPCLGIEPTAATAREAEKFDVPVIEEFFGETLARRLLSEGRGADLLIGNNVYAHVPDINDFTRGMKTVLNPGGCITLEFPHLLELINHNQFDTIYHEHYSYLSLTTVGRIFAAHGLRVWDVELLPTHGGSLRVYGCHAQDERESTAAVSTLLARESAGGLLNVATYQAFAERAEKVKNDFLGFILQCKQDGLKVCGYGAAAKGNTLMNFAGMGADMLPFVADAAPSKQGKLLPGSHIPIVAPQALWDYRPDIVVVFPWNLLDEVSHSLAGIREWGGRFAVAVPELRVL
jgi:SAM-dependent methyltransferase